MAAGNLPESRGHQQALDNAEIKAIDVLKMWIKIATADPTELVQIHRVACASCAVDDNANRVPQPGIAQFVVVRALSKYIPENYAGRLMPPIVVQHMLLSPKQVTVAEKIKSFRVIVVMLSVLIIWWLVPPRCFGILTAHFNVRDPKSLSGYFCFVEGKRQIPREFRLEHDRYRLNN